MQRSPWVNAASTLVLMTAVAACSKSEPKPDPSAIPLPPAAPGTQQSRVVVDAKGFTPSQITVEKGKPASMVFIRTSDDTCAKEVVFPELQVQKPLPLNTPVSIDVPTGEARSLTFQCGMGMYRSAVLVN